MPLFYQRRYISLGRAEQHGHVVYPHATYRSWQDANETPIIFKKNKQDNPALSRFEVAFGEMARLFLYPTLTPTQFLVKDDSNQTVGVACEHLSIAIAHRELLPNTFYKFKTNQNGNPQLARVLANDTAEVPFHFLNEFRPGFFSVLKRSAEKGQISLDMESLAQLLTGSYTLEEDDLHKGNLGFYVVDRDNKPHVVFFKIDHDLMLTDSVMSHSHARFLTWLNGVNAFDITKRDLMNFPRLRDSQNYYWPTVKRPLFGVGKKAYTVEEEVTAFAELATSAEFRSLKWQAFYKHILIPPALIQQVISRHLDNTVAEDRAQIALITQAVVTRQAKLRAVLLTIPEFRTFIRNMNVSEHLTLMNNIVDFANPGSEKSVEEELTIAVRRNQEFCQLESRFVEGDTPLHTAIRLGDYRYHDTWDAFGHYADQKNTQGKTPLDVAVEMARIAPHRTLDIRCDALCTLKHLLRQGAKKTADYQEFVRNAPFNLNNYAFRSGFPTRAREQKTIEQLKRLLQELGEDHRYSLKMQKELAVICVQQFIKQHRNNPRLAQMLYKLKGDLNGTSASPPAPELQFIRKLRSHLWIIRTIRGLLGGTATQVQLNRLVDKELKRLTIPADACCSFFCRRRTKPQEDPAAPDYFAGMS